VAEGVGIRKAIRREPAQLGEIDGNVEGNDGGFDEQSDGAPPSPADHGHEPSRRGRRPWGIDAGRGMMDAIGTRISRLAWAFGGVSGCSPENFSRP